MAATSPHAVIAAALGAPLLRAQNPATQNDLGARVYNVRDHGAKGDGVTLDTASIQAAVDACHRDGGGTVLVPPALSTSEHWS